MRQEVGSQSGPGTQVGSIVQELGSLLRSATYAEEEVTLHFPGIGGCRRGNILFALLTAD